MAGSVVLVSRDADFVSRSKSLLAARSLPLRIIEPGESVSSLLSGERPCVVVVDIGANSGGEAELELLQSLRCREHLRRIPVIAVLDQASREKVMAAHEAGVRDILTKGGDETAVLERILDYCHAADQAPTEGAEAGRAQGEEVSGQWSDPATAAFRKQVQREVNRRLETLPSLPIVVMEILRLVESDKSCASDFEEHISHDPALAARVLRIVNSSFFGLSRTIKSIRDAIVILGFETLKSLVMAASTSNFLNKPAEGYGYQAGGLWKHSIACAVGSRFLAGQLGSRGQAVEVCFVQGLLHDIGKLLLNNFVVDKADAFREARRRRFSLLESENLVLGTDHCQVGIQIAQRWNLPREFTCVIKHHHRPRQAPSALQKQTILVHIANHWCYQLEIGTLPQCEAGDVFDASAAEKIGLDEAALDRCREGFSAQLDDVQELFKMIS